MPDINKPVTRVLHVVSAMNRGGAETLLMNYYRNLDRNKIQFDFVVHVEDEGHYDKEILSLGGRIFRVKSLGQAGSIKYIRSLIKTICDNGPFWAVHSHTDFQGGIVMLAANLAGIKRRVCHSHSTDWHLSPGLMNNWIFKILKVLIRLNSTVLCSCSSDAASFLFGKCNERAIVLPNAIALNPYKDVYRYPKSAFKKKLGIPQDLPVLGHVGRFYKPKNHLFLVRLAEYLRNNGYEFVLLLIGDGPLRPEIEKLVQEKGLCEQVKFFGVREDIPELMRMFDVFVFPSLYEGLGIVLIEAQAAGTPCVISEGIPLEADVDIGLVKRLPLEDGVAKWAESITELLKHDSPAWTEVNHALSSKGYDISISSQKLMTIYGIQ